MSILTAFNSFSGLIKRYRCFCFSLGFFILFGSILSAITSQADIFLLINRLHHSLADGVFKALTNLGDGLFMVAAGCVFLFIRIRFAVLTFTSLLFSGLIAQLIKRILAYPRPAKFFAGVEPIYTIPGYPLHWNNAFPSGHATTAFSLGVVLIYVLYHIGRTERYWQYLIFFLALLVGYSRIYLAQHFFADVLAGALLGALLTFLLIWFMESRKWYHSRALDRRVDLSWFMRRLVPKAFSR